MSKPQVGIQLYSLRDRSQKDFLGTIREVADIGYKNVEFAGYYGHSAAEVRKVLNDTGVNAPSAHIGLTVNDPAIWDNLKKQIEFAQELGLKKFVVPAYPLPETPMLDDVAKFADTIAQAATIVTEAGLAFGYHNHAFEFKLVDGKFVIDHLFDRVPANLLFAEFDLGWVKVGGQDPAAYVRKYAGRVPLVHAKDFKADGSDAEIGKGAVDWDSALAACVEVGVEYVIVEQEGYEDNSYESAKRNFAFFKDRGWA